MEMSSGSLDGGDQPELNSRGFYAAVLPETAFQTDSSGKVGESLLEPFHELEVNFGAAARGRVVIDVYDRESGVCGGGNVKTLGQIFPDRDPRRAATVVEADLNEPPCAPPQTLRIQHVDAAVGF